MAVLKCKMCGGDLNVSANENVVECEYCGTKQTIPNADNEKKLNLFNRANRLRMSCEFDKAGSIYEQIISEFPEEAEAYWCLCLCNYGIEYVDDPATGRKVPTCHRASFEKMRKDTNYELALENADMAARVIYEDQAKEIDRIMGEILSISRSESPYDIFICYKETDNIGNRTPDSVLAQDIYDALTAKNYRVFFSRITLEDNLGTQYEPYIFSALNSAKMMLVVGTDYEYLNAVWVKNEWSRFLKLMAKDKSKVLIPCHKDMDPYDMPDEFKGLQSQDCGKLGFMQDLLRGIDKIFGKSEQAKTVEKVIVQQSENSATTDSLLKRVFMFLEDGDFSEANEYCEKVLDIDPECDEAYLGKLMSELHVNKRKELADCAEPFDGKDNYSKVLRFGDEKIEAEMRGYIKFINERNEEAEKRINQTVETIRAAFEKKISEKSCIFLEDKRENVQSKITELTALSAIFDDKQAELNAVDAEKKTIADEISRLQSRRNSLGIFAGKEKKEIDRKIEELTAKTKEFKEQSEKLKESLKGYESKAIIDNEIVSNKKQFETLNNQIEEKKMMQTSELSFEQALKELKDATVRTKFIGKYSKLYVSLFDTIEFGTYPQDKNGKDKTPISWKILAKKDNKILVISDKALDCQRYNTPCNHVTWETCTLRKWMNGTFLNNAFSTEEQAIIQSTTVSADKNPEYSTNPGNATTDKVFLLSITEVEKYFSSDEDRKCVPTEYAIAQGAYTSDRYTKGGAATCWWWLRSPGYCQGSAADVRHVGSVFSYGTIIFNASDCVRPAMWINLDS